jgi:hypothetical protein
LYTLYDIYIHVYNTIHIYIYGAEEMAPEAFRLFVSRATRTTCHIVRDSD